MSGPTTKRFSTTRFTSAGGMSAYEAPITTTSSPHSSNSVRTRWPHVLLHWEDFAFANANQLLARYREQLCNFNDDIQGTAAIAVGAILSAINVTGVPITEQRIAVLGAGTAGTGICALLLRAMINAGLAEKEARSRFYLVDRQGLLVEGMKGLQPFQTIFAQSRERIAAWNLSSGGQIGLAEVVANGHPTVLIGTSGQAHAFSEPVVRIMAASTQRPVIFPLSNPTKRSLPPLAEARTISLQVAISVAEQAASEGLARPLAKDDPAAAVKSTMWEPLYSPYRRSAD